MPRTPAYILVTKAGPSHDAQLKAIRAAGYEPDPIYEDKALTRRVMEKRELPDRDVLLRQLQPGDVVAISSPGRLGLGKDDVAAMLRAIHTKSAAVFDASTNRKIYWHPELDAAFGFLDRAVHEHKAQAAAAARRAKADAGIKGGAPPKPYLIPEAELRRRWFNQVDYPSQQAVAEAGGRSVRTLYKQFGPRSGRPNAPRRKQT